MVYWLAIFIKEAYNNIWVDSTRYCQDTKGLEVYAWCLMTSHLHMSIGSESTKLSDIVRDTKTYTSGKIREAIYDYSTESRKEWLIWMMERAGKRNGNNGNHQLWQQHNQPIEIKTHEILEQKMNYIHMNPVKAGFVSEPEHWKYSSAIDYSGGRGLLRIQGIDYRHD